MKVKSQYSLIAMLISLSVFSTYAASLPVLVVDKSTNNLYMSNYNKSTDEITLGESFHVVTGKAAGDKISNGDLKTPEGIYFFIAHLKAPNLKPKLGVQALLLNYPNAFDKFYEKDGNAIMLHGTNEPERLKKNYDSEGCIVSVDENIAKAIKFANTDFSPIIVYGEMKQEYLKPAPGLKDFFNKWIKAWSSKDIETYINSYSERFIYNKKMSKKKYKEYKNGLNRRYRYIKVTAKDTLFLTHPKYNVIVFKQRYESSAFKLESIKALYVIQENGQWKILKEASGKNAD